VKKSNPDILTKAKKYAFLLLKSRPRSEKELRERLEIKKIDSTIIKEVIGLLKAGKLIDDAQFAKLWIAQRLEKPFGLGKIQEELKLKGIREAIIEKQLNEIRQGYSEEEVVLETAKEKLAKDSGQDLLKAKRKIYSYLLRNGFSEDKVRECMDKL